MKKLTLYQKLEALHNALKSFNFPEKYYIIHTFAGRSEKFQLVSKCEGGNNSHTDLMTYEEMNCFLAGYNKALKQPLI